MAARILDFFSLDCFEPFRTAETCEEYPARAEVQNWLMWPPVYTLPVAAIVAASRCLRPVPALGPGPEPRLRQMGSAPFIGGGKGTGFGTALTSNTV